jgi:hypothetical protein
MCICSGSNRLFGLWGLPPHISPFLLFGTPCSTNFGGARVFLTAPTKIPVFSTVEEADAAVEVYARSPGDYASAT